MRCKADGKLCQTTEGEDGLEMPNIAETCCPSTLCYNVLAVVITAIVVPDSFCSSVHVNA